MAKRSKRYYSDDDFEVGVTPSQLKRLGRARQLEYIRHWFFRNFEDPANETPHDSGEGGYLYIWGGPYDARDELSNEFGDLVSEEVLEQAIEDVQSDGTYDWAPGPDHPDQKSRQEEWEAEQESEPEAERNIEEIIALLQAGAKPNFGDRQELAERRVILDRLDQMEETLKLLRPSHGGLGHNNPPDDDETDVSGMMIEIQEASSIIRGELNKTTPDALAVGFATSRLKKLMDWFGKKVDIAADSFAKSVGEAAGKTTGAAAVAATVAYIYSPLGKLLGDIVKGTTEWLHNVTLPF